MKTHPSAAIVATFHPPEMLILLGFPTVFEEIQETVTFPGSHFFSKIGARAGDSN